MLEMTQPDIADIVAEFLPIVLVSFSVPLIVLGTGATAYHLAQKYELVNKSKFICSYAKDSVTELLEKYRS
jgi:hypothetical protein